MGCSHSSAARVVEPPALHAEEPKLLGQGAGLKPCLKVRCEEDGANHAALAISSSENVGTSGDAAGPSTEKSSASNVISSNATSRSSTRKGTLYRQRTTAISGLNYEDFDVKVLSYSCFDGESLSSLGPGCHEATWTVQVGLNPTPIVIKLLVDKSNLGTPLVGITSNGSRIYPTDGCGEKAKIRGDFQHKWQFIGAVHGMHKYRFVEMRPDRSSEWLPATLTGQNRDGLFDVEAEMPDGAGGLMQVAFANVERANIREASSHSDIKTRRRYLMLEVPAQDPLQAVLSIDNCELVTHYFARPSPPPVPQEVPPHSLELSISKDRRTVTANVGHCLLKDFASGKVKAVEEPSREESSRENSTRRAWTIQLGPFANHRIEIKQSQAGKGLLKLVVDGDALVEACADDIDCGAGEWECTFRLTGHRHIAFDMHEMDKHGVPLDSRSLASRKIPYSHECRVVLVDDNDMGTASLYVDDINFKNLAPVESRISEDDAVLDIDEIKQLYGIVVPHKAGAGEKAASIPSVKPTGEHAGGLFSICCEPQATPR